MRILHIGKYYPPFSGGIEVFTADLAEAQATMGNAVAVLCHGHGKHQRKVRGPQQINDVEVWRQPTLGRLLFTPISPGFRKVFRRLLTEFRPDVVHCHLPNPSALWAMTVPGARRVPWVVHWHSDIVASDRRLGLRAIYPTFRGLEHSFLRRVSRIICTSPDYVESSVPLQSWRSKCSVIPLGINPGRVDGGGATAEALWPEGKRILSIGRLTYYKGYEYLLRAVAGIDDAALVIAGGGEMERGLRREARKLGIEHRFRLLTSVDDATRNALLASCDTLCLPSIERTEAFGLVLLEALFAGKPVVASNVPGSGIRWVVETAGHGRLVPPADVEALQSALEQVLGDSKGHEAPSSGPFHIDSVARQIDRLYAEVRSLDFSGFPPARE